jgi:aldehyde:ferredoxin oxidoreductase
MEFGGYGSIVDVDLATGRVVKSEIDATFARQYVGGMGFSCKILFDEVGPDVDPFSPDNLVIFANGPLTGSVAPCSGRTEVTTKSPLTEHIGTGNTGGQWGTSLKRAGIDVLVIRNAAERPVYLCISDGTVELKDANDVWGKDTDVTSDIISREISGSTSQKVSVLTIGPAGEHRVRYACPINDYHHAAARGGAGAVMGVKKLKAIVVQGGAGPRIARVQEFRQAAQEAMAQLLKATSTKTEKRDSTLLRSIIDEYQTKGCFPYRNFQAGVLPEWVTNINRDAAVKYLTRKEGTCHNCPVSCFNLVEVNEGKFTGVKISRGIHPGVAMEWGAKCGITNLPAIWKCKQMCQQLGLDYVSAAVVIGFAMELYQRGIISTGDTDGLEMTWGSEDAVVEMLHNIAFRRGFGNVLAEGCKKAAAMIGRGAERYAMVVKGLEMMGSDPRSADKGWVFGQIVNPRGGDNIKNMHCQAEYPNPNLTIDEIDIFDDVKKRIYSVPLQEIPSTWEGKALMCKWFEDLYSILNSTGLCIFPSGFNLAIGPTHISKLLSACTGWDVTPDEIMRLGEKVFTVLKAYTIRQGLDRQDDAWPQRFYDEPLPHGPSKGMVVSKEAVSSVLDEYYELRGWGKSSGLPTEQRFIELGLQDIGRALKERGKIT